MLILRFRILLWVTTRIGLDVLMLKKYIGFLLLSRAAALYSPSVSIPVSFKTF